MARQYMAVGTAWIDCTECSPECNEGRAERERASQKCDAYCLATSRWPRPADCFAGCNAAPAARCSDNQRDDNAATRQKNQPDSVISDGDWY